MSGTVPSTAGNTPGAPGPPGASAGRPGWSV
jgi:hypothetical protein